MKAKIGKSSLTDISHEGGKISFQYPAFKGTYGSVAEAINEDNLQRPSSSQTASLVYDASQNQKGKYEAEIKEIMNNNWLWEFTGNFYLPKSNEEVNNGVIIEHNPMIKNGRLTMDKNSLIKRLNENDSLVKFVPFGYKTGKQTPKELEKNAYILVRYDGEEGASKIAEVASEYKNNPSLWSFDSVDEEKTRMSALYGYWDFGRGFVVDGCSWGGSGVGLAFGVYTLEE